MQVSTACSIELTDKVLIHHSNVANQFLQLGIDGDGAGVVGRHNELLKELGRRGDGEFSDGLVVLELLYPTEVIDKGVWLRKEFACEEHPVKSGRLAIKHHIATFFVGDTAKAPEEIKMPERTVKLAVGDNVIT